MTLTEIKAFLDGGHVRTMMNPVWEETIRRLVKVAEAATFFPAARREHIWKDGSPGYIIGAEEWLTLQSALHSLESPCP